MSIDEAKVTVDKQGVSFGPFCWVSHDRIMGIHPDAQPNYRESFYRDNLTARKYVEWMNAKMMEQDARASRPREAGPTVSDVALDIETTCPKCHAPYAKHTGDEVTTVCPPPVAPEACPRCQHPSAAPSYITGCSGPFHATPASATAEGGVELWAQGGGRYLDGTNTMCAPIKPHTHVAYPATHTPRAAGRGGAVEKCASALCDEVTYALGVARVTMDEATVLDKYAALIRARDKCRALLAAEAAGGGEGSND